MSPALVWFVIALSVGLVLGWSLSNPLYGLAAGSAVGGLLSWLLRRSGRDE